MKVVQAKYFSLILRTDVVIEHLFVQKEAENIFQFENINLEHWFPINILLLLFYNADLLIAPGLEDIRIEQQLHLMHSDGKICYQLPQL